MEKHQDSHDRLVIALLALIVLALIYIGIRLTPMHGMKGEMRKEMYQHQTPIKGEEIKNPLTKGLQFCPDVKIVDMMPMSGTSTMPREYYIYSDTRYEIAQMDSNWVAQNCSVKEQKVY